MNKKILCEAISVMLRMKINLYIVVYPKELFKTLSTFRNAIETYICGDLNVIRYAFETQKINSMIWVLRNVNLPELFTKPIGPLDQALQPNIYPCAVTIDLKEALARQMNQFTV